MSLGKTMCAWVHVGKEEKITVCHFVSIILVIEYWLVVGQRSCLWICRGRVWSFLNFGFLCLYYVSGGKKFIYLPVVYHTCPFPNIQISFSRWIVQLLLLPFQTILVADSCSNHCIMFTDVFSLPVSKKEVSLGANTFNTVLCMFYLCIRKWILRWIERLQVSLALNEFLLQEGGAITQLC